MCGRFAYFGNNTISYESLQLPEPPLFESYNLAPSQNILALCIDPETKQPVYTMLKWGLLPFWFKIVESCAIVTTEANTIVKDIHDRMPVILDNTDVPAWL